MLLRFLVFSTLAIVLRVRKKPGTWRVGYVGFLCFLADLCIEFGIAAFGSSLSVLVLVHFCSTCPTIGTNRDLEITIEKWPAVRDVENLGKENGFGSRPKYKVQPNIYLYFLAEWGGENVHLRLNIK